MKQFNGATILVSEALDHLEKIFKMVLKDFDPKKLIIFSRDE